MQNYKKNPKEIVKTHLNCVNVDWLKLFGKCKPEIKAIKESSAKWSYDIQIQEQGSRQFRFIIVFTDQKTSKKFATLCCDPYSTVREDEEGDTISGILQKNAATFQVANFWLYQPNWIQKAKRLMQIIGFSVKSITRLDVCCDQQVFHNGMKPHEFVRLFNTEKICKIGITKAEVNFADTNKRVYNAITFGKGKSRVKSQIYNKSKEMRDKEMKNYIVAQWKDYGIDQKKEDVWRVELRIGSAGNAMLDRETGEKVTIDWEQLEDKYYVQKIFQIYQRKFLDFRETGSATRKERCKPIKIYDWDDKNEVLVPKQFKGITVTKRSHNTARNRVMVYALDKMITKEKRDILMKSAYILNTINEDDQFKTLKELQEDAGYCIESQFYKELKELIAV